MRLVLTLAVMSVSVAAPTIAATGPATAAEAQHHVTVAGLSGNPVSTWPAYDAAIDRFAVRSGQPVNGLTITASSTDPAATVSVNGRAAPNAQPVDVTDLEAGDEVNVQITDSSGTSNQSWIVTPAGFPAVTTTTTDSGPTAEHVALTLASTVGPSDTYETIVDTAGVPAVVAASPYSHSLMAQPNGHYTVARGDTKDLFSSFGIVELDAGLRPVRELRARSVPSTDFHDAVLLPGGGHIVMAYVRNATTGVLESHVEEVNAAGQVVLTWNSADHIDAKVDPLTKPLGDNAHLNSIEVMRDGNLMLSFRHLSQVIKIDRQTGAVIWRLGGRRSDFTFPGDELGGPCAQHTARELANGDIQIFDNGAQLTPMTVDKMCPNPANPDGPEIERGSSRVTVYRLDETATQKTATLVSSHPVGGFSQFAGSAQRLGTSTDVDNIMVGLFDGQASGTMAQMPDALEMAPDGTTVWSLSAANASSYRALAVPYRDARAPELTVAPADGSTFQAGDTIALDFGCSDQGGSNLTSCTASAPLGSALDNSPGAHAVTVTARDGAGNATTRTITYRVQSPAVVVPPTPAPTGQAGADAAIKKRGAQWKGEGTTRRARQVITLRTTSPGRAVAEVRVRNSGSAAGKLAIRGSRDNAWSRVRWFAGQRDVTRRVRAGTYRTRFLDAGDAVRLRLVVRVRPSSEPLSRVLRLVAANEVGQGEDTVRARLKVG